MQYPKLKELFAKLDVNGDGKITFEEYKTGMEKLFGQCCQDKARAQFDKIDANKNGTIEYDEFIKAFEEVMMANPKVQGLLQIFKEMDKDRSGTLDKKEFAAVVAKMCPETNAEELFAKVDVDKNGVISIGEFLMFAAKSGDQKCCHK